jgi:N-hydroxyarylamine O-acetyltransferase
MDLVGYLDRIGHAGPVRPDLATLRAVHRAHLQAIPYDSLDVQLGRPLTIDPATAYDKIVRRRRGGWCYEMNGLLGWALGEIGFSVTRMAGAAMRAERGDFTIGNHLVLRIDIPGEPAAWIADVGFGDGILDPFPLMPGDLTAEGHRFRLEAMDDGWWRFHNHQFGGAKSFDFTLQPADPALLAEKCAWLQSAPDSPFVLNMICQRWRGGEILQLLGRTYRQITPGVRNERIIASADEMLAVLKDDFALDVPEAAGLWPRVVARHEEVMAAAEADAEPAQA